MGDEIVMDGRLVLPGEEICTSEESLPGKCTYETGGIVYASSLGTVKLDTKEMKVDVIPLNPPVVPMLGDTVIGLVTDIRSSMAMIDVIAVEGKTRKISGDESAAIHISKVSETYTQDMGREFRIGDLVRAKVIQVKPSLQLSSVGSNFGVIRALCLRCRNPLRLKDSALFCGRCERVETRKIASDYGNLKV